MVERIAISGFGIVAELAPACGGLIISARHDGRPLLYTPDAAALAPGTIHYFGNWPLAPFANRAFGAVLRLGGESLALPANDPESPGSTLHGFSWQAPWEVVDREGDRITMRHRQSEAAGPYRYVAEQTVAATAEGLVTELSIVNQAARSLPFGLGLHPWFPREADTLVAYGARRVPELGKDYRPMRLVPVGTETDFSRPRRLDPQRETAIQFVDGSSEAAILYPSRSTRILLRWTNGDHPMFWSPADAPYLCLEPQTHALGAPGEAVAQAAAPLAMLAPGQRLSMRLTLAAHDL